MRKLFLRKKTGFDVVGDTPVIILDALGRDFYSNEFLKDTKFNLPSMIPLQIVSGHFKSRRNPVRYKLKKLPPRERNFMKKPFRFTVYFYDNPNKCSIDWKNERIIYDPVFRNNSIPENTFILYHEFGHELFGTEHLADRYARNLMLKRGYNPSQIIQAPLNTLSNDQDYRKELIIRDFMI